MDKAEAKLLLGRELNAFAALSYSELAGKIGRIEVKTLAGESGAVYQIEIDVLRDDRPDGNLLILASIDDGGWHAFLPLTESRIKRTDGTLI